MVSKERERQTDTWMERRLSGAKGIESTGDWDRRSLRQLFT